MQDGQDDQADTGGHPKQEDKKEDGQVGREGAGLGAKGDLVSHTDAAYQSAMDGHNDYKAKDRTYANIPKKTDLSKLMVPYKTMLSELSWAHKIKDIIEYINLYEKIIKYFKKKYPNKIIDVELSKLTYQQETEAKRLLDFCEIQFKEGFLDFDKNKKLFNKTNSFLQVREKIKKYEERKYKNYYHLIKKKL